MADVMVELVRARAEFDAALVRLLEATRAAEAASAKLDALAEMRTDLPVSADDAGTVVVGTDKVAVTIESQSGDGKRIVAREDEAVRVDGNGMSDDQTWEHYPNPAGQLWVFTLRKSGRWVVVGQPDTAGVVTLRIGTRKTWHDFSR